MPESTPVSGSEDREISGATKTFVFAFRFPRICTCVYMHENLSDLGEIDHIFRGLHLSLHWDKDISMSSLLRLQFKIAAEGKVAGFKNLHILLASTCIKFTS
jgi:hypothetical protein